MIYTAKTPVFSSETIDITKENTAFELPTFEQMRIDRTGTGDTPVWSSNSIEINAGAIFQILEVGLITPFGIVAGDDPFLMSVCYRGATNQVYNRIYDSQVPYLPNGYTVGDVVQLPKTSEIGDTSLALWCAVKGNLATLGAPAELDGTTLNLRAYMKINVDKRMVRV